MKNLNPLVSICIPAFNGANFIGRALDSCLNQTHQNIEVVVADDASTDDTEGVVLKYLKKDKRVRYFKNSRNIGLAENFLNSYKLATGLYLQHLGQDDWLDSNHIEEKVKIFNLYPDIAFVGCGIRAYTEEGSPFKIVLKNETFKKEGFYSKEFILNNFYKEMGFIGLFSMTRRQEMVDNFMATIPNKWQYDIYYRKGKIIDNIVFLKILTMYEGIYYTPKTFYNSLIHSAQASKQYGLNPRSITDNIKSAHIDFVGFEYFYKNKAPNYLHRFRIFKGADVLATVFFDFFSGRAKGFSWGLLKDFFSEYSFYERVMVLIFFFPRLFFRLFNWIIRKLKVYSKK